MDAWVGWRAREPGKTVIGGMPKRLVLEVGRKAAGPAGKASGAGFARHRRSRPRRIALELARDNPVYEGMATKFLQHYVYIAYTKAHGRS
jgi:hypothetical protein